MNEAQRVAEKFGDRQIVCEQAIQEFAQAVAEKMRTEQHDFIDEYASGMRYAARLLLREAGIEEKNG